MEENADSESSLPPQQARALAELLTARTIEDAAQRAGVSDRTLRRWLERGDFRSALRLEQRAIMQHITNRLQQASMRAVDTLIEVMADSACSAAARVGAARAVLDLARDGIDLEWLAERVEALEVTEGRSAKGAS